MAIDARNPSPPSTPARDSKSHKVPFIDDFAPLPANGPLNHAHIINLSGLSSNKEQSAFQLQDAIATALFNLSPTTLESFLSPKTHTFKAVFGKTSTTQVIIWRKGLEVFVGTYTHHASSKIYGFSHLAGFLIGYDGSWHLKATAKNAWANAKWNEVWAGKFASYGGVEGKMSVAVDSDGEKEEEEMGRMARHLAESVIEGRFWEMKGDVKVG